MTSPPTTSAATSMTSSMATSATTARNTQARYEGVFHRDGYGEIAGRRCRSSSEPLGWESNTRADAPLPPVSSLT